MTADTPAPSTPNRPISTSFAERWYQLDRGWKATVLGTLCTVVLLLP